MTLTQDQVHDIGDALVRRWSTEAELSLELLERTSDGSAYGYRHDPFARRGEQRAEDIDGASARVWIGRLQVHTFLAGASGARLPLRLAWRMARDPLPWFLLRIELGEDGEPTSVHLTHIIQGELFSVFAQVFVPQLADGLNDDVTFDFTPSARGALPSPSAASLRTRLVEAAVDLPSYARDKVRLLRLGDNSWARRQIVFSGGPPAVTAAHRDVMIKERSLNRPFHPRETSVARFSRKPSLRIPR
jgi:hypothetical protein